jgi:hypothetical protein
MYDTVNFRLRQYEAGGVDFLAETSCYFDVTGTHNFKGETVLSGSLNGLRVTVSRSGVNIKDGSLCKWYLGDNFQTMGRGDAKRAIEKLSDALHLPMDKANVTRLDIAQNFIVKHPTDVYYNHLGILMYAQRLQQPDGLYYSQTGRRLVFYDKIKEQKNKREPVPELYTGRNVLRYEQRYTSRIATQLKTTEITGALLYDEAFYIKLLNGWRDAYGSIQKINDVSINFEAMKTKQDLYKMGVLSLMERTGGQMEMFNQITEAQKRGELTSKQAYDLRQAVNDACRVKENLSVPNDAIKELDKKVNEAVKYYR